MVLAPDFQASFYVEHGGQPGHRKAWLSEKANSLTNNFFYTLLSVMERGYMRPRYDGYLYFQDHAGQPIQDYLSNPSAAGSESEVLESMDALYRASRTGEYIKILS
jgi:multiple sugar transport system substrate-binding protein